MVANVHGELEFVDGLLDRAEAEAATAAERGKFSPEQVVALRRRKAALEEKLQALYLTLRQFDPESDPRAIASSREFLKPWAKRATRSLGERYVASLLAS
jgi:hypothetical protein